MTTEHYEQNDYVKEFYSPVYGIVLAGGRSQRMGEDKALIEYDQGVPQVVKTYHMLNQVLPRVYISSRDEQFSQSIINKLPQLHDHYENMGPFAGILRAMEKHPEAAWMVVACDLPYLEVEILQDLLKGRNPNKLATSYVSQNDGLPEPLCAIWEARSLERIYSFIEEKKYCPRKLLIQSDIESLTLRHKAGLDNCNTPLDRETAVKNLADIKGVL